MKVSKSGFIACLVLAVISACGGVVFFIINASFPDNDYTVFGVLFLIFAALFAIAAVASLFIAKKQEKRYAMICANLAQMDCHAQLLVGTYGEKGAAGKAAAKTVVSAIGGAIMALFFGFGAYKIYGANNSAEFVLTDGGLFVGRPTRGGLNFNDMTFIGNGQIPATVTVKKHCVIMKGYNGDYFCFNTKNSGADAQLVAERLNKFLHPAKAENASAQVANEEIAVNNAQTAADSANGNQSDKKLPPDDPFGEL